MDKHYKNLWLFLLVMFVLRVITRFFVFSTEYTLNSKMCFGLFLNNTVAAIILAIFFVAFAIWYYFRPKYQLPILLISAGILSNLLDRIFFGGVVDYLSFWWIPTFNFADVLIVGGVLLVIKEKVSTKKSP